MSEYILVWKREGKFFPHYNFIGPFEIKSDAFDCAAEHNLVKDDYEVIELISPRIIWG